MLDTLPIETEPQLHFLQSEMSSVWIEKAAFHCMVEEADRAYPLETGGVLVGYFAESGQPVIFSAIGPGPNADHQRRRFTPDHTWQCDQLDILFEKSSQTWVYIGDWHTHPDGTPRMSWLDQRTLRTIAKYPQSQSAHPLMLIGGGSCGNWDWIGHQYRDDRLLGLITRRNELDPRLFVSG